METMNIASMRKIIVPAPGNTAFGIRQIPGFAEIIVCRIASIVCMLNTIFIAPETMISDPQNTVFIVPTIV